MKASGEASHLVITSSMVAIVPPPISVAYISSKYATLGIAMALRNELAETCVDISVLMPGMSATRIVETTRDLRPVEVEAGKAAATSQARSEEHTSELQSLMRISYAVFCLKKKT